MSRSLCQGSLGSGIPEKRIRDGERVVVFVQIVSVSLGTYYT
jgi:hypothetical protein